MSDVRDALINVLRIERNSAWVATNTVLADAILERFDVVEKPVVTDRELGQMVAKIHGDNSFYHANVAAKVGKRMRDQLEAAGLKIVRATDD